MNIKHIYPKVYDKLSKFQLSVFEDCIKRDKYGLSLPMGSGKTLLSLLLGTYYSPNDITLFICSKSLINSCTHEIKKFFGNDIVYEVLHTNFINNINEWTPNKKTKIIITTPDFISKIYREYNVNKFVVKKEKREIANNLTTTVNHYIVPTETIFEEDLIGPSILFTKEWGCVIIDEIQNYTNIESACCQGIVGIFSKKRIGLSGTMFDEPKVSRILGYYSMLHINNNQPDNIADFSRFIKIRKNGQNSRITNYKGLNSTIIKRDNNEMFIPPEVNIEIIENIMNKYEEKIYMSMKQLLINVNHIMNEKKKQGLNDDARKFSSYKLALITYLRQILVCPLIPITSALMDIVNIDSKSELSDIMMQDIKKLNIDEYLNDPNSLKSTRIEQVLLTLEQHSKERIIIFTNYRTSLNSIKHFINNRQVFSIEGNMSANKREIIQQQFEKSINGVLLLTYEIGSVGLNLQCSSTVLLVDFWWNGSVTKQAIARVLRYGQKSNIVNIYYFTSNTAIEQAIYDKQIKKFTALDELALGPIKTKIPTIKTADIIKLIEMDTNVTSLNTLSQK